MIIVAQAVRQRTRPNVENMVINWTVINEIQIHKEKLWTSLITCVRLQLLLMYELWIIAAATCCYRSFKVGFSDTILVKHTYLTSWWTLTTIVVFSPAPGSSLSMIIIVIIWFLLTGRSAFRETFVLIPALNRQTLLVIFLRHILCEICGSNYKNSRTTRNTTVLGKQAAFDDDTTDAGRMRACISQLSRHCVVPSL